MARPALEVADIFRDHGAAWRAANAGHVSLDQMKVMSAIERCRTAALGGHVARCEGCQHTTIAYNSCRNRHCPKCQGAAAREWLAEREAELLPVGYFHLVFTLPGPIGDIAYAISNRRLVAADANGVTFKWKDYRIEGPGRYKTMTLPTGEFIRRFLMHVLPKGFHRIRHYGLFANGNRAADIARVRELLAMPPRGAEADNAKAAEPEELRVHPHPCPCCGGRMIIIEVFARGCQPSYRPTPQRPLIRIDTS